MNKLNEITRKQFFAQYLFACQGGDHGEGIRIDWNESTFIDFLEAEQEQAFLFLKPLETISFEDWTELMDIILPDYTTYADTELRRKYFDLPGHVMAFIEPFLKGTSLPHFVMSVNYVNSIDYLRSKGYAVPWNSISVEEMILEGWVKLEKQ